MERALCPSCGAAVPEGARFCPSCGHGVTSHDDERRVATVLFADLAGFTGLSETLDPEHLKNLIDRCFARLALDVTGHGGRVDKVVGDAIIALFGAPLAHEDDPERAVRAGLEMQRSLAALSEDMVGLPAPLQLRVGVNSGEVLVGAIRAGGDYTAMGDVVNVASRLQTLAAPGTVVVGPATYAATDGVVRYKPLGSVQPRGREAAVDAWQAVEVLAPPGGRPRRMTAPILGRDNELDLLRRSVSLSLERARPQVTLVIGEAGMGKTRLADEIARWAATEHGALVLEGRCLPYGEANPWWPIAEAVRRACDVETGDSSETATEKIRHTVATLSGALDIDQVTAGLRHLIGDEDALPDVDPQRARLEARRSLHALIAGLARQRPIVLSLAELHWADDVVLELLGWYLERLAGLPVVLLATARPELTDRWIPPSGLHNLLTIHLDPLDREATRQLAIALTEGCLADDAVDTFVARSGGNPFFLEELLSFVGESDHGAAGELPVTLRGLVAARLDSLSANERSVLQDASVIGRSGSLAALTALSASRGLTAVEENISRLFERDLLTVNDGRFEFRSELVRHVSYEILTKSERARRHWSVASWLTGVAKRTGRGDEFLEYLAHHYATAAELITEVGTVQTVPNDAADVAVTAIRKAARWASRREMPSTAVRLLDRAVVLAPKGSAARTSVLLDRAQELATLHELDGARADLSQVFATADHEARARAFTIRGLVEQMAGDLAASAETFQIALSAWRELGDRAGEGDALRRYGMTCLLSGDPDGAEVAFEEALAIARDLGSHRDEAWAMWHLAELSFYGGRVEEAEERLGQAERAFSAAGDTGGIGWVHGLLGYVRLVQGRRAEAESLALSILNDVNERGDRWALGMTVVLLATVRLWEGQARQAVEGAIEAKKLFSEINDAEGQRRAEATLARALAACGRMEEARALVGDQSDVVAFALATHVGDWETVLAIPTGREGLMPVEDAISTGFALLQAGRVDEAAELMEGQEPSPYCLSTFALALVCKRRPDRAMDVADAALASRPGATYRDLAFANLAKAFAHRQQDDLDEAKKAAGAAWRAVEPTDDVVTTAVIEVGTGQVAGDSVVTTAALARLERMGVPTDGWERLMKLAGGGY